MLTTIEEDGTQQPPNGDSEFDFDGDLWFLPMAARPRSMK